MDVRPPSTDLQKIQRFFYAPEVPWGLALIRIILPLILLCVIVPRWQHARELYSTDGAPAPLALNYGVLDFPPALSGTVTVAMMTALVFSLAAASIGWHTRLALALSWGLYTWINMLDCISTFTKYSVISSHVLLLLTLSNCGDVWSVDAWRKRKSPDEPPPRSAAWTRRLVQLLIGLIYFGASFTKMHTDGFMSGDQIRYWLLTNINNPNPAGELLALFPELIIMMSHIAVIWQVLFIFLSWKGRGRLIILTMGIGFHLSTVWVLGLYVFPPIMITTYLAWVNEDDINRLRQILPRLAAALHLDRLRPALQRVQSAGQTIRRRTAGVPVPAVMVFAVALMGTMLGGIKLEAMLDPYGEHGPDGPYTLKPLSEERMEQLFQVTGRMREADKFFAMELGTETIGGVVVHRSTEFEAGDHVIAQCTLVPPHDDMFLKCDLRDANGNTLVHYERPVTRNERRADFHFYLPQDLPSGQYVFEAESRGQKVLSRTVQVESDTVTDADTLLTN